MTSKQRFLAVLNRQVPDRLPVTTHHVMPYYLDKYLDGISNDAFFDRFGMDPIQWVFDHKPDPETRDYYDPEHMPGYLEPHRIASDTWRITMEDHPGSAVQDRAVHIPHAEEEPDAGPPEQ